MLWFQEEITWLQVSVPNRFQGSTLLKLGNEEERRATANRSTDNTETKKPKSTKQKQQIWAKEEDIAIFISTSLLYKISLDAYASCTLMVVDKRETCQLTGWQWGLRRKCYPGRNWGNVFKQNTKKGLGRVAEQGGKIPRSFRWLKFLFLGSVILMWGRKLNHRIHFYNVNIHQNHLQNYYFQHIFKMRFLNKLCLCSPNTALRCIISHLMEANGEFINEVLAYFVIF